MIKFLFGAFPEKRREYILSSISSDIKAGEDCILIVPEQEAVATERKTLETLPPSSGLCLEVLNFSRLYNRACREYGGLCYSYITAPAKHLCMWKTLKEVSPLLSFYRECAENDASFADTMLSCIGEFKAAAVSAQMLELAADAAKSEGEEILGTRLADIALIYSAFDLSISEKYTDSADDISKLCVLLDTHNFFENKNVYIDSFTSFTAVEHRVIERIFRGARNVTISIPLRAPDALDISTASTEDSLKRLSKNAGRHGGHENIVLPSDTENIFNYINEVLWNFAPLPDKTLLPRSDGKIIMESCENSYSEAECAASHILELLRGGARCRDIAVIARDASKYKGIIEPAFERAGIPYFMSEKTDLCTLAPIKFILSAIRIKQYNWRKGDIISHIKTGLCDIAARDADIFEEYINTWSISGERFFGEDWTMNPDGFSDRLTERGADILACANRVRRTLCLPLYELFVLLDAATDLAEAIRALYAYLEKVGLEKKTLESAQRELAAGNKKSASELAGVYDTVLRALAGAGEAVGNMPMSTDNLYTVLKAIFDNTDIGTIPTSIDEVTIGSASLIRAQNPRFVFVLGLCEGEFPQNTEQKGLFSSADRDILSELDIELGANEDMRSSDELMFVKNAFCAPREGLYLFTSVSDIKGGKRTPSLPFRRIEHMFSDLSVHRFVSYDLSYLSGTAKSAAAHLKNIQSKSAQEAARAAASEHLPLIGELWDKNVSTEECRISPELVKDIIGDKIYVSPSSLEKYVMCPFSYYTTHMLSLREKKLGRFGPANVGNFVHYVMEHAIRFAIPDSIDATPPTKSEITKEVGHIVRRYIELICPDDTLKSRRMEHLYARLHRLSLLIIESVTKEFADSDFRPAFFELHIDGRDGNPAPLSLPLSNGATVNLKGFVDRVDIFRDKDEVYIRIADYKTGAKKFALSDLQYGLNTQMLLYLFALCTSPGKRIREYTGLENGKNPLPAGVVYLSSAIPKIELQGFDADEGDVMLLAEQELSRTGIMLDDEKLLYAMSHSADSDLLLGVKVKDGKFVGSPLLSSEELDGLFEDIKATLTDIGEKIYSGVADCKPLSLAGVDPCKYCTVKQLCRKNDF